VTGQSDGQPDVLGTVVDDLARQLFHAAAASAFDPAPVVLGKQHRKGAVPVRRLLQHAPGRMLDLSMPLNRNSFLFGCFDATADEGIEHLIIGFGHLRGSTTEIVAMRHEIGETHRVAVPTELLDDINAHILGRARNEVIVFHNHPPNPLHVIFDNEPLASMADRALLLRARYLQPIVAFKTLLRHGNLRFYIGENGYVREFTAPVLTEILALATSLR
jgi:hypothetical protein